MVEQFFSAVPPPHRLVLVPAQFWREQVVEVGELLRGIQHHDIS